MDTEQKHIILGIHLLIGVQLEILIERTKNI